MTEIKTLIINYSNRLKQKEISMFRGAVIASIGEENVLLHNHVGEGYRYAYPEIQYKSMDEKATIVAINKGIDSVRKLCLTDMLDIHLGNVAVTLNLASAVIAHTDMTFCQEMKNYTITSWLPLNQENYKTYKNCEDMISRIEMLQRTLTGNIISMAKGLDIHLEERIELKIINIREQKPVIFKRQNMMAFNAVFAVNMVLPSFIGLGKGSSLGFGTIKELS